MQCCAGFCIRSTSCLYPPICETCLIRAMTTHATRTLDFVGSINRKIMTSHAGACCHGRQHPKVSTNLLQHHFLKTSDLSWKSMKIFFIILAGHFRLNVVAGGIMVAWQSSVRARTCLPDANRLSIRWISTQASPKRFTCRVQNPNLPRAVRVGAAHGGAAGHGRARQNWTPTDRVAQKLCVPLAIQSIVDSCPERPFSSTNKGNPI